ncbi:Ribosome maturation factor RimP [bioreactor metagenome]|uniref:Ribosome maturation factor RimP n=1 Tax=bioreactor metagenome TaxID=1076179 RepID=A0A645AWT6_9ZZZZ
MSKITSTVDQLIRSTVESLGMELVDVEFAKDKQTGYLLTVYIDKEGGVTMDDCERVSVAIDPILDQADPIEQSYYLCVSSPGLDRPLKKDADFIKYTGKKIIVKLYSPIDKEKEFTGVLVSFNDEALEIETGKIRRVIPRSGIALVKPYIEIQ